MTRHTKPAARGAVDAARGILMAARRPLSSQEIADLLGGEWTRAQITRACCNLCRYSGFRRIKIAGPDERDVIGYLPGATNCAPVRVGIVRPKSAFLLQEVWR